ncbi:MAG: hypothetical protein MUP86_02070, partial [Dehalococcoidia bacterium]|nr:hypothetical protein [Dehalococcoidia bacterium]
MNPPEAQLRNILELERRKGYADKAVIGGIDRYLKHLVEGGSLAPNSPVMRSIMALPSHGYASLSLDQQQRWLAETLALLSQPVTTPPKRGPTAAPAAPPASPETRTARAPGRPPADRPARQEGLSAPITVLRGISRALSAKFAHLGVETIRDLLYFFPRRHNDFAHIRPISELVVGEEQTVIGTVWSASETAMGRRLRGTEALVGDDTGVMRVVWFNQPYLARQLRTNTQIVLAGKVNLFKGQKTL